jgi:hypothetical protein
MTTTAEQNEMAETIARRVAQLVRRELKLPALKLLTVNEVAAMYRIREKTVRDDVAAGKVKCKTVKPRSGKVGYLIDADDAARVFGAM